MELIIFNQVLYGSLKPWHSKDQDNKFYRQQLTPSFMTPDNPSAYFAALKEIHPNKLELYLDDGLNVYQAVKATDRQYKINAPLVTTELSAPLSSTQRFYHFLLSNETTRITNRVYNTYTREISEISKRGIIQEVVKSTKDLLLKIGTDYQTFPQDDLSKYVIRQLIQNLIRLLKEIELLFPTDLISIASSKEEIYSELLGIEIPEGDIDKPTPLFTTVKSQLLNTDNYDIPKSDKVSFGFKGNHTNLETVLHALQKEIELLNVDKTTVNQLYSILTSKNLSLGDPQIHITCQSNLFNHIWRKLKPQFTNLGAKAIADTNLFYTLNGKPFTKANLEKKVNEFSNPLIDTINNIIKQL